MLPLHGRIVASTGQKKEFDLQDFPPCTGHVGRLEEQTLEQTHIPIPKSKAYG